jgi:hypothetical protein
VTAPGNVDKWADLRKDIAYLNKETDEFIVFLDQELEIDWSTDDDYAPGSDPAVGAVSNRVTLLQTLPCDHLSPKDLRSARIRIGEGMARALEGDIRSANDVLDEAQEFILGRRKDAAKLWYMVAAGCTAIAAWIAAPLLLAGARRFGVIPETTYPEIAFACSGGVFGAALSTLTRGEKLTVSASAPLAINMADGVLRIVTGAVGGVAMWLLVRAQLIMPSLHGSPALVLLAAVGGFSERLVPALMSKVDLKILDTGVGNSRVSPSGTKGKRRMR